MSKSLLWMVGSVTFWSILIPIWWILHPIVFLLLWTYLPWVNSLFLIFFRLPQKGLKLYFGTRTICKRHVRFSILRNGLCCGAQIIVSGNVKINFILLQIWILVKSLLIKWLGHVIRLKNHSWGIWFRLIAFEVHVCFPNIIMSIISNF